MGRARPAAGRIGLFEWDMRQDAFAFDPGSLALHGWEGRAAQFQPLASRLVPLGFQVVALDAPAHGRSPGREADPVVFADALQEAAAELGDVHAVVGQSMGGASVLYALSRGLGSVMADSLRQCTPAPGGIEGLEDALQQLIGREALVFLVSDFHWPLDRLGGALDLLSHAFVVPVVVWDPAETEPPPHDAIAPLRDARGRARPLALGRLQAHGPRQARLRIPYPRGGRRRRRRRRKPSGSWSGK